MRKVCLFSVLCLVGLAVVVTAKPQEKKFPSNIRSESRLGGGNAVRSVDGKTAVVLPSKWKVVDDLNAAAGIQAKTDNAYFIIIAESREDLTGWNLERHSRSTLGKYVSKLDLPEVIGPIKVTINGYPGVQYEVRGSSDGFKFTTLSTTLETPTQYMQIMQWCPESVYAANRPDFEAILQSVREPR